MDKLYNWFWIYLPVFLLPISIGFSSITFEIAPQDPAPAPVQILAADHESEPPQAITLDLSRGQIPKESQIIETVLPQKMQEKQTSDTQVTRISIDSVGINAPLIKTSLNPDKNLMVPSNASIAGWYGAEPGQKGIMLITAHYDSSKGPGAFYRLRDAAVGDAIAISLSDGASAVYKVTKAEVYNQDNSFPWNKVYPKSNQPQLRLITCHGTYNPSTGKYSHNLVVYASIQS